MLGHPLSPPAPPSQPVQAYPLVNGDISLAGSSTAAKSPPAPHSATYPQPFAMDQQPSTTLSKSPSAQRDEPKKEEKQSQGQGQKQPMFAPPVLSHDIFASLPLPGGAAKKKTEVAKDAEMPVQVETAKVPAKEEQDVRPNGDELAPEPQRDVEGAAAEPAKTIPSPPAAPVTVKLPILPPQLARQSSSQQPLLLDKSDITSFVNGAATNAAVGMADGAGPIEKDEFIKRVVELIQASRARPLQDSSLGLTKLTALTETEPVDAAVREVPRAVRGAARVGRKCEGRTVCWRSVRSRFFAPPRTKVLTLVLPCRQESACNTYPVRVRWAVREEGKSVVRDALLRRTRSAASASVRKRSDVARTLL